MTARFPRLLPTFFKIAIALVLCCSWAAAQDKGDASSQTSLVYVFGQVNNPGAYAADPAGKTSVLKTLLSAGGVTEMADVKRIEIFHKTSSGGRTSTVVDLESILRGITEDRQILPSDMVVVPSR